MPASITLKNIPDALYEKLKETAEINHRSLNSEVIFCLERVLYPVRISTEERLERARKIRAQLNPVFSEKDIMRAIKDKRLGL